MASPRRPLGCSCGSRPRRISKHPRTSLNSRRASSSIASESALSFPAMNLAAMDPTARTPSSAPATWPLFVAPRTDLARTRNRRTAHAGCRSKRSRENESTAHGHADHEPPSGRLITTFTRIAEQGGNRS